MCYMFYIYMEHDVYIYMYQEFSMQAAATATSCLMRKKIYIQCQAPQIAKLVNITPIIMVYGTYNYSYWGESKPTSITGGPHIVPLVGNMLLI